jgi:hypothetical protein
MLLPPLLPEKPSYNWTEGQDGPRAVLNVVHNYFREKYQLLCQESNLATRFTD